MSLQATSYKLQATPGFTLIEVVISTFIIGTVVVGMFGLFLMSLRSAQTGERRIVAVALANERMEMIRNLPYVDVGTQGGVPAGSVPQEETVERNGQEYQVRTDIRYVDDPFDGEAAAPIEDEDKVTICHKPGTPQEQTLQVGAPALDAHLAHGDTTGACGSQGEGTQPGDEYNADYKQVRVEVSWPNQYGLSPILLITYVAPHGIEGGELGGTLDFHAFDADGDPVAEATLRIVNNQLTPTVDITTETNSEGRVVLPGLPEAADSYEITVTKAGYTTEQTYAQTATFVPTPDYAHASMIVREVTEKTFLIDHVAALRLTTQDLNGVVIPNVAYTLRGSKTIGQDDNEEPVYKFEETAQTGATGQSSHNNLEWDSYTLTTDGATTGYDIKETSLLLPLVVNPADDLDLTVKLVPYTPISLHVTVVDPAGNPIDNATVTLSLSSASYAEGHGTGVLGQVFFNNDNAGLPVNSDQYQLDIDAPGFQPLTTGAKVEGTSRVRAVLAPI